MQACNNNYIQAYSPSSPLYTQDPKMIKPAWCEKYFRKYLQQKLNIESKERHV